MGETMKYKFCYEDRFGNVTEMNKVIDADATLDDVTEFDSHVEQFKMFLLSCGYSHNTVEKLRSDDE